MTESISFLIDRLGSPEPADRLLAARELGKRGEDAAPAIGPLVAACGSDDPMLRGMAAAALGKIGEPAHETVPVLAAMLADPVIPVRFWAADALGRLGVDGPGVREGLTAVATDEHPLGKAAAAAARRALGQIGVDEDRRSGSSDIRGTAE